MTLDTKINRIVNHMAEDLASALRIITREEFRKILGDINHAPQDVQDYFLRKTIDSASSRPKCKVKSPRGAGSHKRRILGMIKLCKDGLRRDELVRRLRDIDKESMGSTLHTLLDEGRITKTGQRRGTRYHVVPTNTHDTQKAIADET